MLYWTGGCWVFTFRLSLDVKKTQSFDCFPNKQLVVHIYVNLYPRIPHQNHHLSTPAEVVFHHTK